MDTWTSLGGLAAIMSLDVLLWHFIFLRGIRRPAPRRARLQAYPPVTVIRPIRGLDVDLEDNLRAALDTGYPGPVETLFIVDEERDPAFQRALSVVEEHRAAGRPGRARVLVAGPPPEGRTGKLNAMHLGCLHASSELIAFGDSDTRPDREVLRVLVESLMADDTIGCTFSPVKVDGPLETAGDTGYAYMINSLYSPPVARCAGDTGELPFIMGQLMLFRRPALEAIGGVTCADGQLVDDMYIGVCVRRAGFKNVMVTHPLRIVMTGLSLREFLYTYRRWMLFSRNGLPWSFTWPLWLRGVEFFASMVILLAALVAFRPGVVLLAALTIFLHGLSLEGLQRQFAGVKSPARGLWMAWGLFLLVPVILLSMTGGGVTWRGRSYKLDCRARLS